MFELFDSWGKKEKEEKTKTKPTPRRREKYHVEIYERRKEKTPKKELVILMIIFFTGFIGYHYFPELFPIALLMTLLSLNLYD